MFFYGLGSEPFHTKGEPREALVVWEMLHGGGWILPLRNGDEIPSKPPLFHWLGALASLANGQITEGSIRAPSAAMALLTVLATFAFGAGVGRVRSGWLAAIALATSFEWLRAARAARVDMTLTFFLFACLLTHAVIVRRGVTPGRRMAFWAAMALATLGKGPVGIVLPLLVVIVFHLAQPSPAEARASSANTPAPQPTLATRAVLRITAAWDGLRELDLRRGLGAVLALTGLWYLAAVILGGEAFFVKQILKENLLRVLDPEALDSGHRHGPLYLVPSFFVGALPWSLFAPAVGWWLWRSRPLSPTLRHLVVWVVTVVAFFSLSASKRSVYILSAYPAAALLFGLVLGPGPEGVTQRRIAAWAMRASAVALAAVAATALLLALGLPLESMLADVLAPHDAQGLVAASAVLRAERASTLFACFVAIAGAAVAWREAPGAHWLRGSIGLAAALVGVYGGVAGPAQTGVAGTRSLAAFARSAVEIAGDRPIEFYRAFDYGTVYYSGRHLPPYSGPATDGSPRLVMLWEDEAARQAPHVRVLLRSDGLGPKGRSRMVLAETSDLPILPAAELDPADAHRPE